MRAKKNGRVVFRSGKKVDLVILRKSDVEDLLRWFNDQEMLNFLSGQEMKYETDEEEWLANLSKRRNTDQIFGVATKRGRLIGTAGLHGIDRKNLTATGGIAIGEKSFWGKGYGSEAEMLLASYAFLTLNLRKINAGVFSNNSRSLKAAIKGGAVEEGRRKKQFYVNGEYVDEIILAVFKEDWSPRWKKYFKQKQSK
ncbi:MAG: GNAT family protein [bacterium]|nr:GNAT family protein [bacterium]